MKSTKNNRFGKNDKNTDIYKLMRNKMVAAQIISRGVKDEKVIEAMQQVRREQFVDKSSRQFAYDDRPLSIGYGQTISQPYIVALMTELLEMNGDEKVLEIGTGSGYQTAILSKIARCVYSVEIIKPLYERTRDVLKNYTNVYLKNSDGYNGWPEHAPYDRIITTAAPENVPQPLLDQLKDGGIMVLPKGPLGWGQALLKISKRGGRIITEHICDVAFVPLTRDKTQY